MASQKKPAASARRNGPNPPRKDPRSGAGKRGTPPKNPPNPKKRKAPPYQPDLLTRGIGAALCVFFALLLLIGFVNKDALVVEFVCTGVKGLVGYGFYTVPFALLLAAYLLLSQRERPVNGRLWCVGLLPLALSAFLHLILCGYSYGIGLASIATLGRDGGNLLSGGMLGGMIAVSFSAWFSTIGAGLILVLVILGLVGGVFRVSPTTILIALRRRREERERFAERCDEDGYYDEEEDLEGLPLVQPQTYEPPPPPFHRAKERRRKIPDLPLDEEEEFPEPPREREAPHRQEPRRERGGFFRRSQEVEEGPEELVLEETEPEDLPWSVPGPSQEPEPRYEPEPAPPSPPPPPPPPPPQPAPLMTKAQKQEELRKAEVQVADEIGQKLDIPPQDYIYPPLDLLTAPSGDHAQAAQEELEETMERLSGVLKSFGIDGQVMGAVQGPSVTRYEISLKQGVRLNKLTNLSDDVALALGVSSVRIAPVPDKISMVGVEVPNRTVIPVNIREVLSAPAFQRHKSSAAFSVGKDIGGNYIVGDCAKLPHMLIAGTTGSGKSVCINSLIISMLYKSTPEELRLIMVDPKMVELGGYNGIPHLLIPVVTDPQKAAGALQWAVTEMMKRYRLFSEAGVRELSSYNHWAKEQENVETMPKIVIVIDELADLMLVAAKEVEESICRVAQMGRAAGMHLVIATQRPSADVITGLMKANIPSRVAFAVASSLESRIILDNTGAEKLVGKGDMLWFPLGSGKPLRVQGCFISDEEVAAVAACVKQNSTPAYDDDVMEQIEQHASETGKKGGKSASASGGAFPAGDGGAEEHDELFPAAVDVILELGQASVSMLQRRLKLGYARAARLVDQMEEEGIVGPFEGSKPRQLLITKEQWEAMKSGGSLGDAMPEAPPPVEEEILTFEAMPQSYEGE